MSRKAATSAAPVKTRKTKAVPPKKQPAPVENVVAIDTVPSPRRRPTAEDLSKLSRRVMEQQKAKKTDGFGKPVEAPKAVEFTVKYADGRVANAVGEHADVIVRFSDECQTICIGRGLAYYGGPPLQVFTAAEWEAR